MAILDEIGPIKTAALDALNGAGDLSALDDARVKFLGSKGELTAILKQMGGLTKEERPIVGKEVNIAKAAIEKTLGERL